MKDRLAVAAATLLLTCISIFIFPGRTILQSDTQIYLPIFEHLYDSEVLAKDLVAVRPHVSYSIYDEMALTLRRITGLPFEPVLQAQQFVYRALGILGLFLLCFACGLSFAPAFLVTAIASLGSTISGPAVLTVEYEPVPRGFAMPWLLLSLGLLAWNRWILAAVACSVAFLFHPPTGLPAFCLFFAVACWFRKWVAAGVAAGGAVLLIILAAIQTGVTEQSPIFRQVPPALEQLQRMRASYNWVSIWFGNLWKHYLILIAVCAWGLVRVRALLPQPVKPFFYLLPLAGVISVPVSWLLLENLKWALIPQLQPGRYLVFVALMAMIVCPWAAYNATRERRYLEAFMLFALPAAASVPGRLNALSPTRLMLIGAIALVIVLTARYIPKLVPAAALLPALLLPTWGKVSNYPNVADPQLDALIEWAQANTPVDAMFQFADAGRAQHPGVFRARARRALYVDWKSGGQVNFLPEFAAIWWDRWQKVEKPLPLEDYAALGIDYVVFSAKNSVSGAEPVYENSKYAVYRSRREIALQISVRDGSTFDGADLVGIEWRIEKPFIEMEVAKQVENVMHPLLQGGPVPGAAI